MGELTVRISSSPSTPGTTLTGARELTFQEVLNDSGAGSVTIQNDDPQLSLLDFNGYLQWCVDGVQQFCTIIETSNPEEVAQSEEAGQATTFEGRGLIAEWERATVRPELGFNKKPYGSSRLFGFASPYFDDSTWTPALERFIQSDFDGPPVALGGVPDNAPEPFVYWIWSRAADNIPNPGETSPGTSYFRKEFIVGEASSTGGGTYRLCLAVDNTHVAYIDGLEVSRYDGPSTQDQNTLHELNIELSNGPHIIAVEGSNILGVSNTAGVYVFLSLFSSGGLDGGGPIVVSDDTWVCLDYPSTVPGFTHGHVLEILLDEAQEDWLLNGWTLSFDATQDTDGTPWPLIPGGISVQVGADLLTVLRQFAESGIDFAADPDAKILNAWVTRQKGGDPGVTFTDGVNVTERSRQRRAPVCNRAQIEFLRGIVEVESTEERGGFTSEETYGPIRKRLDLTDFDSTAAVDDYLTEWFRTWAWPQETVTVGIEPEGTPLAVRKVPYDDFVVGDVIDVDGEELRLTGITANTDDVGNVRWTVDAVTEGAMAEGRLDRMLKAKIAGTVGGRALAASPTVAGVQGNDDRSSSRVLLPTMSSYGAQVSTGVAGEVIAEGSYRITGLVATSSADGTGNTVLRVTNVDEGTYLDVTIGAAVNLARTVGILDVAGGNRVKLECTTAGGHSKVDLTTRGYII